MRRISGVCGIVSPLIGLAAVVTTIRNSPWFSWTESELSILGVEGSMATLFNLGLIITGFLSLVFAIGFGRSLVPGRVGHFGVTSLLLGSLSIAAVGFLPRTFDLPHDSASIAFFVLISIALLLIGFSIITRAPKLYGVLSLTAGVITFIFLLAPWPWPGGAIEQLLSCMPWSLWTLAFGVRLLVNVRPIIV